MKLALALGCLCLTFAQAIAQIPAEFSEMGPESQVARPLGGGDTFATATAILSLPFSDIGTTCGFADDFSSRCGGVLGQDVVYRYVPATDECVDISLCGSIFDTILSIVTADTLLACNDDGCGNHASRISRLFLQAGATYYIVIDNRGATCGKYYLSLTSCCEVSCPPGGVPDDDICCPNPAEPCPGSPFTDLACGPAGVDVCGTYFAAGGRRDTDWFRIQVDTPSVIHMEVTAESPTFIGILLYASETTLFSALTARYNRESCVPATCDVGVPAGTYYLYVAPTDFNGLACGTRYTMHASCTPVSLTAIRDLHGNDSNGVPLRAGETVSVLGVVMADWPSGAESRFTVQDGTGGIAVVGEPASCPVHSDQVLVSGVVAQRDGWTILGPPLDYTFLHIGALEPEPVSLTTDDVNAAFRSDGWELFESRLVRLDDVEIRNADGTALASGARFEANADYQVVSLKTERSATLRILSDANDCGLANPLVGMPIPTGCALTVTGVLAQFDPVSPHRDGYTVLPRFPADVAPKCSVRTEAVTWARLKATYR